ncbi:hypothetical protein F941_02782 [Acinetobacter bouvetii DSM 14964 = CIP 107468]|uniref:DUF6161 domain-containing protein n=1 Tax=Acinetobacter bouvetii DSM 14964 = CIP 107468 TaxID=1120925 RepID=N9DLM8_9GAMM|nr:DUF6161 domain-containing protein [Acinetobacter bouvetii]ENV81640.1 hypothetical protein F941_02782 [Acinetobacter bouvetii DSM 14964 = CIP 107468]BCU63720.1 hypothetical protein ACBO_05110 [Acinetobacter bouvetii]
MEFNITFYDSFGNPFDFETLQQLKNFLNLEKKFWSEQKQDIGENLTGNFSKFPEQVDRLFTHLEPYENALSMDPPPVNIDQLMHNYEGYKSQFIQWCGSYWIYRGNPNTEALINAYRYSTASGIAFWNAIKNKRVELGNQQFHTFIGMIMAYEFVFQDHAQMFKRRNSEKKTFSTLRNELESERNEQIKEFQNFCDQYSEWSIESKKDFENRIADYQERSNSTIQDHSNFFNEMADHAINRNKELEDLYVEKLRLEKPAKYWENRAKDLKNQGIIWSIFLVVVLGIGIAYFSYLFTHWLKGQEIALSLHSLQGAILLAVIISMFVFSIRVLSRLVFSSFHLQRDAEERQQLAYVYLALSNETNVDEESRKIVLQALFSRAETGLLASESGPTMPGVEGIAGLISKANKA